MYLWRDVLSFNTPPQNKPFTSLSAKALNLSLVSALVSTSASWWEVGIGFNSTSPDLTRSCTKWCWMSMCFVLAWCMGFLASPIHLWLSLWITVAPFCGWPMSASKHRSQMASFVACVAAMYSASVEDRATVTCHLDDQLTGHPLTRNVYPVVDLWSLWSPPQSVLV